MHYLLMNQNTPVLRFACTRDAFDEPVFREEQWLAPYRPIGYRSLTGFLEGRKAPKHRAHIQALLERYGCEDLEGFLRVTHALSLNDSFWVKPEDSNLNWEAVSLYTNPFDTLISMAAFDGFGETESLSATSPEFGTDGNYAKCWMREGDGIFLYKTGSQRYEVEPLSEFLAAQLARLLCPAWVPYDLAFYRGKLVSKCPLFTSQDVGLAKAAALFREDRSLAGMLAYFERLDGGDAFRRMCILDALIYNPDRHLGNFGILYSTKDMKPIAMSPVFDHNRSLFPELDQEQLEHPDWYLEKCRPILGSRFLTNARGMLTDSIRQDLQNLRGFNFCQHPQITAPQERLDALSSLVNRQLNQILG